jgi:hypothetical protein
MRFNEKGNDIMKKLTAACRECGATLWWEDQESILVYPFCLDIKTKDENLVKRFLSSYLRADLGQSTWTISVLNQEN